MFKSVVIDDLNNLWEYLLATIIMHILIVTVSYLVVQLLLFKLLVIVYICITAFFLLASLHTAT